MTHGDGRYRQEQLGQGYDSVLGGPHLPGAAPRMCAIHGRRPDRRWEAEALRRQYLCRYLRRIQPADFCVRLDELSLVPFAVSP